MATYTDGPIITRPSASDYSAKQWYIVKISSGNATLASAATDKLVGVITNVPDTATGSPVAIGLRNASGTLKVIAGGSISAGDYITSDSAGKAVVTTSSGNVLLGMALEAADSGDIFEFMPLTDRY